MLIPFHELLIINVFIVGRLRAKYLFFMYKLSFLGELLFL